MNQFSGSSLNKVAVKARIFMVTEFPVDTKIRNPLRRVPKVVPYDNDARDADGDGLVQEGTIWERPVGTRYLSKLGEWLKNGLRAIPSASSLVDGDRNKVSYKPGQHAKSPLRRGAGIRERRIRGRGQRRLRRARANRARAQGQRERVEQAREEISNIDKDIQVLEGATSPASRQRLLDAEAARGDGPMNEDYRGFWDGFLTAFTGVNQGGRDGSNSTPVRDKAKAAAAKAIKLEGERRAAGGAVGNEPDREREMEVDDQLLPPDVDRDEHRRMLDEDPEYLAEWIRRLVEYQGEGHVNPPGRDENARVVTDKPGSVRNPAHQPGGGGGDGRLIDIPNAADEQIEDDIGNEEFLIARDARDREGVPRPIDGDTRSGDPAYLRRLRAERQRRIDAGEWIDPNERRRNRELNERVDSARQRLVEIIEEAEGRGVRMPNQRDIDQVNHRFPPGWAPGVSDYGLPERAFWRDEDYDGGDAPDLERLFGKFYDEDGNINARGELAEAVNRQMVKRDQALAELRGEEIPGNSAQQARNELEARIRYWERRRDNWEDDVDFRDYDGDVERWQRDVDAVLVQLREEHRVAREENPLAALGPDPEEGQRSGTPKWMGVVEGDPDQDVIPPARPDAEPNIEEAEEVARGIEELREVVPAGESQPDDRSLRNVRNRFPQRGLPERAFWRDENYEPGGGRDAAEQRELHDGRFGRYFDEGGNINDRGELVNALLAEEREAARGEPRLRPLEEIGSQRDLDAAADRAQRLRDTEEFDWGEILDGDGGPGEGGRNHAAIWNRHQRMVERGESPPVWDDDREEVNEVRHALIRQLAPHSRQQIINRAVDVREERHLGPDGTEAIAGWPPNAGREPLDEEGLFIAAAYAEEFERSNNFVGEGDLAVRLRREGRPIGGRGDTDPREDTRGEIDAESLPYGEVPRFAEGRGWGDAADRWSPNQQRAWLHADDSDAGNQGEVPSQRRAVERALFENLINRDGDGTIFGTRGVPVEDWDDQDLNTVLRRLREDREIERPDGRRLFEQAAEEARRRGLDVDDPRDGGGDGFAEDFQATDNLGRVQLLLNDPEPWNAERTEAARQLAGDDSLSTEHALRLQYRLDNGGEDGNLEWAVGNVGEAPDGPPDVIDDPFGDIVEMGDEDIARHIGALNALRESGELPSLDENRRIVRRLRELEAAKAERDFMNGPAAVSQDLNPYGPVPELEEGRDWGEQAEAWTLQQRRAWLHADQRRNNHDRGGEVPMDRRAVERALFDAVISHREGDLARPGEDLIVGDMSDLDDQDIAVVIRRLREDGWVRRADRGPELMGILEAEQNRREEFDIAVRTEEPPVNRMDIADIMDEMAVLRRMHGGEAGIPDEVGRRYQELYEEHLRARPNAPKPEQLRNRAGLIARGDGDRRDTPDSGVDEDGPQPPWSVEPGRFWRDDQIEHHMGNQNDEALGRIVRDEDDWPGEQGLRVENLRRADREAFRQQARLEMERRRENRRPGTTMIDLENMNRDELNQRITRLIIADPEGDDEAIRGQLEGALMRRDNRLVEDSRRSPSAAYLLAQRNNLQALGDDEIDEEIRNTQAALGLVDDPHGGDYEGLRERLANALAERGARRRVAAVDAGVPDTSEAPAVPEAPAAVDVPEVLRSRWENLQNRLGGDRDFDMDDDRMFGHFLRHNDQKIERAVADGENVEAARLRAFRLMATRQRTDLVVAHGVASLRDGDMRLVGDMERHNDMMVELHRLAMGGRLTPEQLDEILAATLRFEGEGLRAGGYGEWQKRIRGKRRRMVELKHIPRVELGDADRRRLRDLDEDGFEAEVVRITGANLRLRGEDNPNAASIGAAIGEQIEILKIADEKFPEHSERSWSSFQNDLRKSNERSLNKMGELINRPREGAGQVRTPIEGVEQRDFSGEDHDNAVREMAGMLDGIKRKIKRDQFGPDRGNDHQEGVPILAGHEANVDRALADLERRIDAERPGTTKRRELTSLRTRLRNLKGGGRGHGIAEERALRQQHEDARVARMAQQNADAITDFQRAAAILARIDMDDLDRRIANVDDAGAPALRDELDVLRTEVRAIRRGGNLRPEYILDEADRPANAADVLTQMQDREQRLKNMITGIENRAVIQENRNWMAANENRVNEIKRFIDAGGDPGEAMDLDVRRLLDEMEALPRLPSGIPERDEKKALRRTLRDLMANREQQINARHVKAQVDVFEPRVNEILGELEGAGVGETNIDAHIAEIDAMVDEVKALPAVPQVPDVNQARQDMKAKVIDLHARLKDERRNIVLGPRIDPVEWDGAEMDVMALARPNAGLRSRPAGLGVAGDVDENGFVRMHVVPRGHMGIDTQVQADRHVRSGGNMSDVPDDYLAMAMLENASAKGEPIGDNRFSIVVKNGGAIGTTYVLVQRRPDGSLGPEGFLIKAHGPGSGQRRDSDSIGELVGAELAHNLGLPMLPGRGDGKIKLRGGGQGVAIVTEHAFNSPQGGADMRTDVRGFHVNNLPDGERAHGARLENLMVNWLLGVGDRHTGNGMLGVSPNGDVAAIPIDLAWVGQNNHARITNYNFGMDSRLLRDIKDAARADPAVRQAIEAQIRLMIERFNAITADQDRRTAMLKGGVYADKLEPGAQYVLNKLNTHWERLGPNGIIDVEQVVTDIFGA